MPRATPSLLTSLLLLGNAEPAQAYELLTTESGAPLAFELDAIGYRAGPGVSSMRAAVLTWAGYIGPHKRFAPVETGPQLEVERSDPWDSNRGDGPSILAQDHSRL